MNYLTLADKIKSEFTKEQLRFFDLINAFDSLKLANGGNNDTEGYQVFTPSFIVKDMVKAIGEDVVFDPQKTILEPTSGDGAFTTYILIKRLEGVFAKDYINFATNALRCLSTIYSIEMDEELIIKQRNNIFTAFILFFTEHNLSYPEGYLEVVKCMILLNFIWAKFNTDQPDGLLLGIDVIYKMPEAEKGKLKSLDFPVWNISDENIDYAMEGADIL